MYAGLHTQTQETIHKGRETLNEFATLIPVRMHKDFGTKNSLLHLETCRTC